MPDETIVQQRPTVRFAEPVNHEPAREDVTEVDSAKAKLRAFEDDVFGKDVSRINGEVERGVGSPYARMTDAQKAHHLALEKLIAAEKAMADASADLAKAQADHEAAVKKAADAEQAAAASE